MKLTSKEFGPNESIPRKFTCQGEDLSPELSVAEVPDGARSLALIMEDPDAPGRTFDHWIAYDIPADTGTIEEGTRPGTQGTNDFGKTGYGGPCPPSGTHRYFFRVYALDEPLDLPQGIDKRDLERAMDGHILDQAELVGRYAKSY
jgi:Raf kinase inhibitor-like YbhB/YbcL family protein